jgi:hypothetical protein
MDKEKGKIIVKGGHLWQDGVKLKLEFGNLEQIEAIRNNNRKMEAFLNGEIKPNCSYEVRGTAGFFCMCGNLLSTYHVEAESEDDIECFEGLKITCKACDKKYEFVIHKEYSTRTQMGRRICINEELGVKLIQK